MTKTRNRAEVAFDTGALEEAAKIAEADLQLSAIPFLGIARGGGGLDLIIAQTDPKSLRATGGKRQFYISREDNNLLASLAEQARGQIPVAVGLIRPQGQISVMSRMARRALGDSDVLRLDEGERDLLNALAQQVGKRPEFTVVVSDSPLGPKMAVWETGNTDEISCLQPQIVPLGKRRE